ncbi:hypothetical protein [Fusobacterium pseudoperiodonticum]|uniref:DUF4252 domain-containing protein n=1 Tax=Fusobacterium pseudoperiodonticum TaxID=2663009 RepID=A0A2D3NUS9_9FUSO|nr:hypothetical protein [Fusobacterium pseudoperiodonticum]ATV59161.1 hypothetical protein CTM72_04955 [Fusobacterium pseudoperiodonticum]
MKKFLVFFLAILALTFVACGKDKNLESYLDMEKIQSEFNIDEKDDEHIKFKDKDETRSAYRIFNFQKMKSVDFKNPKKIDKLEEFYLGKNCDIIYKDESTIIVLVLVQDNSYAYNIQSFDDSKTELIMAVSIGSDKELSETELFNLLDEAKSFIK